MTQITITEAHHEAERQWQEDLKRVEKLFEDRKRAIDQTFRAAELLASIGFEVPPVSPWGPWNGFTLLVQREDLKRMHNALGRLKLSGKEVVDCKKRTICVSLTPVTYPPITIQYVTRLPKTARCQIVTQRQPAYTYKAIVCKS
jgi:hypothetical protein